MVGPSLVAIALTLAADDDARWRRAVTMAAGGLVVGVVISGLAFDAAVTLAEPGFEWPRPRWEADPSSERVLRVLLELAVCVALVPLARGRTAGLLAFALATGALAYATSVLSGPRYAAGCMAWDHPVWPETLYPTLGVALSPWIAPMLRALRARPTPSMAGPRPPDRV